MHPIAALRTALIGQWLLAVASVVLFSLETPGLPELLKEFYLSEELVPTTPFDTFVGWYAGAWALGSFVASVGVFFLEHWARHLYLAMVFAGVLLQVMLEPSVTTAWSEGAESGAEILSGIVVGLLYFLPLTEGHARDVRTE